ncbi:hypothetical protein V6N13_141973 [Hibiscus sabdariffa]
MQLSSTNTGTNLSHNNDRDLELFTHIMSSHGTNLTPIKAIGLVGTEFPPPSSKATDATIEIALPHSLRLPNFSTTIYHDSSPPKHENVCNDLVFLSEAFKGNMKFAT